MPGTVLCVHGGAGALRRARLPLDLDRAMRAGLRDALHAGHALLAAGESAVDAVEAAVRVLEDCEVFNAGRGSVLTAAGGVEMDASIMRGADRAAGAVACVRRTANPVCAARALLEQAGGPVMLVGGAADDFAERAGLRMEAPGWFVTPARWRQLEEAKRPTLDHDDTRLGTVGAVAVDRSGGLAAATSTGGLTRQASGRVGDSPILGAGTWADDRSCAVSATGEGEAILRTALAHQVDAEIRLGGRGLEDACRRALAEVASLGGRAGCIAVDPAGRVALPFETEGMARGLIRDDDDARVALYTDEPPFPDA